MWLVTGGSAQGKLDYVLKLKEPGQIHVADGADCSWEDLLQCSVINHFHLWIKRMLTEGTSVSDLTDRIMEENPHVVIIADELGCGVVPMNREDRTYRETTGRICCQIAKKAEQVHLVVCGIGMVIKNA